MANRRDIGPFTIIPEWVVRSVSPRAAQLYIELGLFADRDTGECWPSHATLAERMGCSEDTVQRAQSELVEAEAIAVGRRETPGGGWRSNLYTVMTVPASARHTPSRIGAVPLPQSCGTPSRMDAARTITNEPEPGNLGERERSQPAPKRATPTRGRVIQDVLPWTISDEMYEWAKREVRSVNLDRETTKFVNHWKAASGANARKRDWVAAWRNWMLKASEGAFSR